VILLDRTCTCGGKAELIRISHLLVAVCKTCRAISLKRSEKCG
jgi:hypothetical protein